MTESAQSPNASPTLSRRSKPPTQSNTSMRRVGQAFALVFASTVVAAAVQHADGQGSAPPLNTESSFDGNYYSREFNYGFRLDTRSRTATATISNSPLYKVGQLMLRYHMIGSREFAGEQLFTDGNFHPIIGRLLDNGAISIRSVEPGPRGQVQATMMIPVPSGIPLANPQQAQTPSALNRAPAITQGGPPYPSAGPAQTGAETGRPTSVDDFRAATTDMRSGNYAEAMLLFRRIDAGQDISAETGGQYNKLTYQEILTETRTFIGDMNERGLGVPQDYKAARYWYQKAIDTGGFISMASARLARLYEQGLGGAKDHQKYLRLDPIQSVKEKEAEERREAEETAREEARAAAERKANPQYARQQCESGCSTAATLCENNKSFGTFAFWAYPRGGGMFRGMAAADAIRNCSSQRASCLDSCTR